MPIGLPKNRPKNTPNVNGLNMSFKVKFVNSTPALANANNGIIAKDTRGYKSVSKLYNIGSFLSFEYKGINIAKTTPLNVACRPDFKTPNHNINPIAKYEATFSTLILCIKNKTAMHRAVIIIDVYDKSLAWKMAITNIAARSSMIARVKINNLNLIGTFLPNKDKIPTTKAISVAIGIAQPL